MAKSAKKGKTVRKYKPSTLLKWALELLSEGHWVQGALHMYAGDTYGSDETTNVRTKKLNPDSYWDNERILQAEGWCMVGVCDHINTPNQNLAKKFLAVAIDRVISPDAAEEDRLTVPLLTVGRAEQTIIGFNDDMDTRFRDVKKVFNRAIKLAQEAGQ